MTERKLNTQKIGVSSAYKEKISQTLPNYKNNNRSISMDYTQKKNKNFNNNKNISILNPQMHLQRIRLMYNTPQNAKVDIKQGKLGIDESDI